MKNSRIILSVLVLVAGIAISYAVSAQTAISTGITFPIPELGNCGSKAECRDYCNKSENIAACADFAKTHGLMNEDEAEKAAKFAQTLRAGGGPGGCKTPQECQSFCSNVSNIETCIAFAEKQGFKDNHIEEGKKILSYIQGGGQMPGGCTSKESCEVYCGDFNHAEECSAFAERAGLTTVREGEIPPGQFQKFIELAKKGETPGQCKSKDECEAYCRDSTHFEECVAFGEKLGFIKPEQADLIRRTGGKGPGGCDSQASCEAFCNDSANQETCFKFAEENGLIPKEELERAKDGFIRMRQGLENAPPEVAACLKSVLGENIIADIQSGKLTPGSDIGERVRTCFEKFGESHRPTEVFRSAPPEVLACLKEKLGDTFEKLRTGQIPPTPEIADTFRVCFQNVQFEKQGLEGPTGAPPPGVQNFLRTAPPVVQVCLKEKLGETFEQLQTGRTQITPELGERIKSCFESFRPDQTIEKPGFGPPGTGISPGVLPNFSNLPPEVLACVKEAIGVNPLELGSDARNIPEISDKIKLCYEKLRSNVAPPPSVAQCRPTGCSNQVCSDRDITTTCEYRPEYSCFKLARCERQASGACGWTLTSDAQSCIEKAKSSGTTPPPSNTSVSSESATTSGETIIEMKLEADDAGFYPSSIISVPKGAKVRLTFVVRTERVYYGGLDFRSSRFRTDPVKPGSSVMVEFLADQSFDFISYWPLSDAQKAVGKVIIQ